jgi:hypothetical protein
MLDDRVGGMVQPRLNPPGARFNKGNDGITIRTGDIISTDMKRIASYDEKETGYLLEIGNPYGNWMSEWKLDRIGPHRR